MDEAVNDFKFIINDFPQQVRWKLTHRDTITEINEFTGLHLMMMISALKMMNFVSTIDGFCIQNMIFVFKIDGFCI